MEYFDLENPLTSFKEHQSDTLPTLFADESLHMPSLNFNSPPFAASFRRDAISLISKAQFSYNLDPFIPYLAVNYLDRFISQREIPHQGKPWMLRLVVISCLSLAAKMKNTDLSLSDLQGNEGCIYDARSINRMEVLILTTLNWRMRSITPFSFLYFFLSLLNLEDPRFSGAIKYRASEILFKSQCEIKLLEYKPSIIAASAILCASNELFPSFYPRFRAAIFSCEHINKLQGSLEGCLGVIQDMVLEGYELTADAVSTSTKTPISVMERHCTTSESENTVVTERDSVKRRKLNGCCNDQLFQLSQSQLCWVIRPTQDQRRAKPPGTTCGGRWGLPLGWESVEQTDLWFRWCSVKKAGNVRKRCIYIYILFSREKWIPRRGKQ